jgi:hypothetical protein
VREESKKTQLLKAEVQKEGSRLLRRNVKNIHIGEPITEEMEKKQVAQNEKQKRR